MSTAHSNEILHVGITFITRGQKTAKTECGKRVSTSLIAIEVDANCTECRGKVEANIRTVEMMRNYLVSIKLEKSATEIDRDMPRWRAEMYRTKVWP